MSSYPNTLLPKKNYKMISCEDILSNSLVRETTTDIYAVLDDVLMRDAIIRMVVDPQSPKEVFELSLFLFGYYTEDHVGLRVTDESLYNDWSADSPEILAADIFCERKTKFPLFLSTRNLYKQSVRFEDKDYVLSFTHKPTYVNFWHFQLYTLDEKRCVLRRDTKNKHFKRLAQHLLERIVAEAIIYKKDVIPFVW